jgi:hypothetical protein
MGKLSGPSRKHARAAGASRPDGLGAGIWTRDVSKAHALAKKIRAGTVWINCYNVFDAALPFGGYKQSGWGREMGHQALEAYTVHPRPSPQVSILVRAPIRTARSGPVAAPKGWSNPIRKRAGHRRRLLSDR